MLKYLQEGGGGGEGEGRGRRGGGGRSVRKRAGRGQYSSHKQR